MTEEGHTAGNTAGPAILRPHRAGLPGPKPDWSKHAKAAPFKRDDKMLDVLPIGVANAVFPGTGIQNDLADKAKRLGIPVWRFDDGGAWAAAIC